MILIAMLKKEEDIYNLISDSNTKFVDKLAIENLESDISEVVINKKDDSNVSIFIPTTKAIEGEVCIVKSDSEYVDDSDDVGLSNLVVKKLCLEIE